VKGPRRRRRPSMAPGARIASQGFPELPQLVDVGSNSIGKPRRYWGFCLLPPTPATYQLHKPRAGVGAGHLG